jgi:hypothetical protein
LAYEGNQGKNLEGEGKHSDTVLTDFEDELRMLEEWLVNSRIDKEVYIIVASTQLKGMLEASTKEEEIFVFQTNYLFEHAGFSK